MAEPVNSRASEFFDPKLSRRLAWRIWRRGNLGALVSAAVMIVTSLLAAPVFFQGVPVTSLFPFFLVAAPVFFAFGSAVGACVAHVFTDRAVGWMREGREPSGAEIKRIAAVPRLVGFVVMGLWCSIVPVIVILLERWIDVPFPAETFIILASQVLVSGVVGAFIAFLLTEQVTRPILARVLQPRIDTWPRTIGMGRRLLVAWTLVAAVPIGSIAFFIGRLDAEQRSVAGPSLVIACLIVVVLGFVVFSFVGQAFTGPIERVRAGLRAVATGDFETVIPPTDPGELGLLQVGLNEMVVGLRERERLRDLFGRHVGVEVVRRAMADDHGLGGEQREATTMFVDVIASTHLAQTRAPDEVVKVLNAFFDAVVRAVSDEGGFINKFAGDGAMCIFGAPDEQRDHAERALRAALALRDKLANLDGFAAAIGVSSGTVVAGNVGALDRYEYTVVGDPVNEASRLTDEAKLRSAHVLVSSSTIKQGNHEATNWKCVGEFALRGRAEPTEAYEPL